jgi:hypothetical protein
MEQTIGHARIFENIYDQIMIFLIFLPLLFPYIKIFGILYTTKL